MMVISHIFPAISKSNKVVFLYFLSIGTSGDWLSKLQRGTDPEMLVGNWHNVPSCTLAFAFGHVSSCTLVANIII